MRTLLLLITLIVSSSAFAQKNCSAQKPAVQDLKELCDHVKLEWWSVSAEAVSSAPCKNHEPPTEATMLSTLGGGTDKKISETVNGISFKDEDPAMIQLFKDLNTFDETKEGERPLSFKSNCDKVLCAAKEIFGDKEGVQLLYMLKKHGFNGSSLRTANSSPWKTDELNDILTALSDYPDSLYPLDYNRQFTHYTRGVNSGPVVANASMVVFDLWNKQTPQDRQQLVLHELGHVIAQKKNLDSALDWYDVGGWTSKTIQKDGEQQSAYTQPAEFAVSKYGSTSPVEDFAETVAAYRFDGANLKTKHPGKYNFIKDHVFDGKEFLSAASCKTSLTKTEERKQANDQSFAKALAAVKTAPAPDINDAQTIKDAQKMCLHQMVQTLGKQSPESENCTNKALRKIQLNNVAKSLNLNLDTSIVTNEQLVQVPVSDGMGRAFNKTVRANFAKDVVKSLGETEKFPRASRHYQMGTDEQSGCKKWAFAASNRFQNSSFATPLLDREDFSFFDNNLGGKISSTLQQACLDSLKPGPYENNLDLAILKNLP